MNKISPDNISAISLEEILPQSSPMILIDEVKNFEEETIESGIQIKTDSMFAGDEGVPAWVGIEFMAQTIAAYSGIKSKLSGEKVNIGFLVGSRNLQFSVNTFPTGSKLNSRAKLLYTDQRMGVFDCSIHDAVTDKLLVQGKLSVYQPDNLADVTGEAADA